MAISIEDLLRAIAGGLAADDGSEQRKCDDPRCPVHGVNAPSDADHRRAMSVGVEVGYAMLDQALDRIESAGLETAMANTALLHSAALVMAEGLLSFVTGEGEERSVSRSVTHNALAMYRNLKGGHNVWPLGEGKVGHEVTESRKPVAERLDRLRAAMGLLYGAHGVEGSA